MTTPAEAIDVLNRIHAADPTVLPALIDHRVECNRALADDPTVQVGVIPGMETMTTPGFDRYNVGLLGIINGIFGIRSLSEAHGTQGWIAAVYDADRNLKHFTLTGPFA